MKPSLKRAVITRVLVYAAVPLFALAAFWAFSIRMPGRSYTGALAPLTAAEDSTRQRLQADVELLATGIGERNQTRMAKLDSAARFIDATFRRLGYAVASQSFTVATGVAGRSFRNVEATLRGAQIPGEIVLVGAHYDSVIDSPGADDNASGTASMLELARMLAMGPLARTVRFVAFANEEPPFYATPDMGSAHYARMAKERGDNIVAMLSLESIGYYSDAPHSQQYPLFLGWFYPDRGNFIGVVGNVGSRSLVHRVLRSFRARTQFPSEGSAAPRQIPGIGSSDQLSFWKEGYPGVMITGTAPNRNANYHTRFDTPQTLDFARMARVVHGVGRVVVELARQ